MPASAPFESLDKDRKTDRYIKVDRRIDIDRQIDTDGKIYRLGVMPGGGPCRPRRPSKASCLPLSA